MDIRDMLTKLTLLEGAGIAADKASGTGLKATGGQGIRPTGDLKHGMPMRLNTGSGSTAHAPKPVGVKEAAKPDFLDVDKDGDKTEPFKKAVADKKDKKVSEAAKPDFLDVDKDGNRKESFKKAVADKKSRKAVKENLRLVRETALGDRQIRVYHDREYQEYHVCVTEGDAVISRQFAGSTQEATDLVRSIVSEARGMKVAWPGTPEYREKTGTQTRADFRKKYARSVSPDELSQLDTQYDAAKGRYGKEEEPDDEEGTKKAARDPNAPKRGRGRPKGTRRAIGAKGPTGRSKLMTREDYDQDEYDEEGEMAQSQSSTIVDAAQELQDMLSADENLPEWVQKKITLAQEYIDSARDYLKSNRPEDSGEEMSLPEDADGEFTQADYDKIARKKRHLMMLNRRLEPEDAEEMAAHKLGYDYDQVLAWVNADHEDAEGKPLPEGSKDAKSVPAHVKPTKSGFTATAPQGKRLSVTMPQGRGVAPSDVKLKDVDEADYSAKKARAGKDIGKPGKQFAKIAKSAGERYGSKERGEKVAGAVLAKLRKGTKEDVQMEGAFRDVDDKTGNRISAWLDYHSSGVFDDSPELGDALIRLMNKWDTGSMSFRELQDRVFDMFDQGEWQRADFIKKFSPKKVRITQPDLFNEEEVTEKAVSKAQRAAAGIARAAQKGDIPKSKLRGASREMAQMEPKELKKFAKTKEKGLPEKVREVDTGEAEARRTAPSSKKHNDEVFANARERSKKEREGHEKEQKEKPVKETTTAGSVATAPAEGGKKSKGGIEFGKGIYEGQLAESFDAKLASVLDEGTTITINSPDNGDASVSINGTGEDAMALANLLKMAGLFASDGYHGACSSCGQVHEGECRVMEEGLANSADNTETMSTDYMVNNISGGLNGPKLQVNPNNAGDNPLAMGDLGQKSSPAVNLGAMAEQVQRDAEDRLLELYKRIV